MRQETITQLKQTHEEVDSQKAELEDEQGEQQTLLYERCTQQVKPERTCNKRQGTLSSLELSVQQGQQQLGEMRASESHLRNSAARAGAVAKARAEREICEAQAARGK